MANSDSSKKTSLRAVILAAGQGTRMKSKTPKVLHKVLGKTIISRVLESVTRTGSSVSHVVLGHGKDEIEKYLEESGPNCQYETHLQEPQLGTGHALMQVLDSLKGFQGNLLVTVGDAPLLKPETLKSLVDKHNEDDAVITVLSTIVEDPKSYGRVIRNKEGFVEAIVEAKDASEAQLKICEINSAIYCFKWPAVESGLSSLKADNKQKEYYLTDLIGWASKEGLRVSAMVAENWWEVAGVNSRVDLAEVISSLRIDTNKKLALESGVTIVDPASTWIAPEVEIGSDTVIYPGCEITGSVKIGEGASIGPNSTIRGDVTIGDGTTVIHSFVVDSQIGSNCRIGPYSHVREGNSLEDKVRVGNFVELKKTSVGSSTNVSHLSYVGDTKLGSGANIGAGTITANYDHITKIKSKTVIGDGASTGSNSVIVAPVTIGKDAFVAAGTVVTKDVPDGALAVARAKQVQKEEWSYKRKDRHASSVK